MIKIKKKHCYSLVKVTLLFLFFTCPCSGGVGRVITIDAVMAGASIVSLARLFCNDSNDEMTF